MRKSRRSRTDTTQLDKLLSNVIDYKNLLSFLSKNYPQVLEEWKLKIIDYQIDYWGRNPQQYQLIRTDNSHFEKKDECK